MKFLNKSIPRLNSLPKHIYAVVLLLSDCITHVAYKTVYGVYGTFGGFAVAAVIGAVQKCPKYARW